MTIRPTLSQVTRYRAPLLVVLLLSAFFLSGLTGWLRETLLDSRFRVLTRPATGSIALVEIDAPSIEAIGHWPWPRGIHAQILTALEEVNAAGIVFDIDFSSRSTLPEDAAFAAALKGAGGSVVLPAFQQRSARRGEGSTLHVNKPIPSFAEQAWLGLVNVVPDSDGIMRRYPFGAVIEGEFIPSVGALMASRHDTVSGPFRIDFGIRASSVPSVSAIALLRRDAVAMSALRGRTVIISGTAAELGDRFTVPNGAIIPGSMIQAVAAESILQDRALNVTSAFVSAVLMIGVLILISLAGRRFPLWQRMVALAGLALTSEALALLIQWRYPVAPDTSLVIAAVAACIIASAIDEIDLRGLLKLVAERRFQRVAMSLGDGLICADALGRLTMWNTGAEKIFGYAEHERIGQSFESLLGLPDSAGISLFRLLDVPLASLHQAGGCLVELIGCRKNGERFDLECSFSSWETPDGIQYGAVLRDISQRKRQQERIRYLAERDPATGLANRNTLLATLQDRCADASILPSTLLLVSIDRYSQIGTLHGASFADELAVAVARRLERLVDGALMLARLSGGEFAFLANGDVESAKQLAQSITSNFAEEAFAVGKSARRIAVSIGLASSRDVALAEVWLGNSQFALSAAKTSGSPICGVYEPAMRDIITRRENLEAELQRALANDEFELFYQPQIELKSRGIIGAEALIRWRHPERGYVSPGEFMPVVNTTTLSEGVAAWVLRTAFSQAAHWERLGHSIRVGINLSQSQFVTGDLVADVADLLAKSAVSPGLIELEVTEDIILESTTKAQMILEQLQALGVKIAFDDFGTGYGSLTYLKAFPLDTIKIDQSFVKTLAPGSDDAAIVEATIDLGHALGLSVIAEGIETEGVAQLLSHAGCDEGQGYLISKPIPADAFERLITETSRAAA